MKLKEEFALMLLLMVGLSMLLALVAAPVELERDTTPAWRDGDILAHCMNGRRISLGDGHFMVCQIIREIKT